MTQPRELAARFESYGDWRRRLAHGISALHAWIKRADLADERIDHRVDRLLERLEQDRFVVAFVADSGRGKSELINAIFFADSGRRLLPTAPARKTMCPAELLYDPARTPSIRLLPIETRLKDATVQDLRNQADEWVSFPLNLSDPVKMGEALAHLSEVKRVSLPLARALGKLDDDDASGALAEAGSDETIEVPCWRHAIVNFPHPLLLQGLVIVDTPGLTAVGVDPELTLNLLPDADAVLFVIGADAGVTKDDLEVWTQHLAKLDSAQRARRIVVLNKIDLIWDRHRSETAAGAEIERLVTASQPLLGLPRSRIYPISAQKGLSAKIDGDDALLDRSRLALLEDALCRDLLALKHDLVGAAAQADIRELVRDLSSVLESRRARMGAQLDELRELRSKNEDVMQHMMERVREERTTFDHGLQRFTALRTVFTQQTSALFDVLGLEALRSNAGRTRESIERSKFTRGVRNAMGEFFRAIRRDFDDAERRTTEIHDMMQAMYTRFSAEQGVDPFDPPPFEMGKYRHELDRIEQAYNEHFDTLWNMLVNAKYSLTQRFFETVTSRVKNVYDISNRDMETWLRAVMSPLEARVAECRVQLQRRIESVKRIHVASSELEERIAESEQQHEALAAQLTALKLHAAAVDAIVLYPDPAPATASV